MTPIPVCVGLAPANRTHLGVDPKSQTHAQYRNVPRQMWARLRMESPDVDGLKLRQLQIFQAHWILRPIMNHLELHPGKIEFNAD
jgi:hypothetical protein